MNREIHVPFCERLRVKVPRPTHPTEMGARHVATIQTLLATCRAHDINAYTYLVDVLQRINLLPANRVHELTPREWQQCYADNPLRSDLASTGQ